VRLLDQPGAVRKEIITTVLATLTILTVLLLPEIALVFPIMLLLVTWAVRNDKEQ